MNVAVIVAAGKGLRMGTALRKQYLPIKDQPILARTLNIFDQSRILDRIILVVPKDERDYCHHEIIAPLGLNTPVTLISGGRRRQDSVYNGLKAIEDPEAVVLIHDGVRPLLSEALIKACVEGVRKWGACIPAVPVIDTLKKIDDTGRISKTVTRENLYVAQTPQAFKLSIILAAHEARLITDAEVTDDAALVEVTGGAVHIIPGEIGNIKITTPADLALARDLLNARQQN